MSAVNNFQNISPSLPLSKMTMLQLNEELSFWTAEIASDDRWGRSTTAAIEMRSEVEEEMGRRHLAARRGECFIVDDPGVRPVPIVIPGSALTRSQRVPPRLVIACVLALAMLSSMGAWALAADRVLELEARFAAEDRV